MLALLQTIEKNQKWSFKAKSILAAYLATVKNPKTLGKKTSSCNILYNLKFEFLSINIQSSTLALKGELVD